MDVHGKGGWGRGQGGKAEKSRPEMGGGEKRLNLLLLLRVLIIYSL